MTGGALALVGSVLVLLFFVAFWVYQIKRVYFQECPQCGQKKLEWVKDWIIDPEEPPMFAHWECRNCDYHTSPCPTKVLTQAAQSMRAEGCTSEHVIAVAELGDKMEKWTSGEGVAAHVARKRRERDEDPH